MITVIHGDDIERSRTALRETLERYKEVRRFDGRGLDPKVLVQTLHSPSLFGEKVIVVIENFLTNNAKKMSKVDGLTHALVQLPTDVDLVVWEEKELTQGAIAKFGPKANVQLFKIPVLIFQFLDSLKPGQAKSLLQQFGRLVQVEPPEVIFVMTFRRIRQILMIAGGATPEGLQGWQLSRLTTQSRAFTMEKLLAMYRKLHEIDVRIKTGSSPYGLASLIEQFLIDI